METSELECDVVVIGGGLSGLRTAMLLEKNGVDVLLLEARNRVGGRTRGELVNGIQYDIGGQWVGPTQTRVLSLAKEFNLQITPQYCDGLHVSHLNGITARNLSRDVPGIIPYLQLPILLYLQLKIDRLAWQVPIDEPWNAPRAEEWDYISVDQWVRENSGFKSIKAVFDIIIWALLCTEPSRVSFLWFLWFVRSAGGLNALIQTKDGAQQDKIKGGAVQISQIMHQRLGDQIVHLNSPVQEIIHGEEECVVITTGQVKKIKCKRIVMTCPPVFASRIVYSPPLPPIRDALTQSYPMGQVIKAVIFYDVPFWRTKGRSGESTSDCTIRLSFDASNIVDDDELKSVLRILEKKPNYRPKIENINNDNFNNNIINNEKEKNLYGVAVFFLGDEAIKWSDKTTEQRRIGVEQHLKFIFQSETALHSTNYIEGNWVGDEWGRGAYMGVPGPSVLTSYGEAIRTPIGRIHFGGTETATQWSGYMEGALQSAERVTNEIVPLIAKEIEGVDEEEKREKLMLSVVPKFNGSKKKRWFVDDNSYFSAHYWVKSVVITAATLLACRLWTLNVNK